LNYRDKNPKEGGGNREMVYFQEVRKK